MACLRHRCLQSEGPFVDKAMPVAWARGARSPPFFFRRKESARRLRLRLAERRGHAVLGSDRAARGLGPLRGRRPDACPLGTGTAPSSGSISASPTACLLRGHGGTGAPKLPPRRGDRCAVGDAEIEPPASSSWVHYVGVDLILARWVPDDLDTGSISASPTACPLRGHGRMVAQDCNPCTDHDTIYKP